jgi:hypothetical protein
MLPFKAVFCETISFDLAVIERLIERERERQIY